jgi:hypothetical protein
MGLTLQERHAVDSALNKLAELFGGTWTIGDGPSLDDLHPTEPSPECLVTNGSVDAAIEVKRLTGDAMFQAYTEALKSNKRWLAPSCGGYYMLGGAIDLRLPMDGVLRRHLKKEIERVAPELEPGGPPGVLRMPREAVLSLSPGSAGGAGLIYCCHNSTGNLVSAVSGRVKGAFLLVDDGLYEHQFVTDAGRAAFEEALVAGCEARLVQPFRLKWVEEWPLWRCADSADGDPGDRNGVWIIATTDAREIRESVSEAVEMTVEKATRKFQQRWAAKHVIVLDREEVMCTAERVREALTWFSAEELKVIDLVLLTEGEEVSVVWQLETKDLDYVRPLGESLLEEDGRVKGTN